MKPLLLSYEIVNSRGEAVPYDAALAAGLSRLEFDQTEAAACVRRGPARPDEAEVLFGGYGFKRFAVRTSGAEVVRGFYFKLLPPPGTPAMDPAGLESPLLARVAADYRALFRGLNAALARYERGGQHEFDLLLANADDRDFAGIRAALGNPETLDLREAGA